MAKTTGKRLKELISTADTLFRNNGRTVDEITSLLGISRRELNRTLQTLSLCGLPPYDPGSLIDAYIEDDRVYVSHAAGFFDRPARLSRDEAVSLFLAARAAAPASSRPDALDSALPKIRAALRPPEAEHASSSERIDAAPESGALMPILNTLKHARGREKVRIEYYTAGKGEFGRRVIHPFGLIYHIDRWYCPAHCEKRRDLRLFRVDRIKSATPTGDPFDPPADFDLEDFRRNRMFSMIRRPHRVLLRFLPARARMAKEKWPDRAKTKKDGSVEIEFHVDALEKFVPTVLGYGAAVEVASPEELKEMVKNKAGEMLRGYEWDN